MNTDQALSRRRVLSVGTGVVVAGLAGCLGDESPESTPESDEVPTIGTESAPAIGATSTAEPDHELIPRAEFDCASMGDSMAFDDAADRPFVFGFDRPEGWIREVRDTPSAYQVDLNAPVGVETGGFLYTITVSQFSQAVDETMLESRWEDERSYGEVGTLPFAGEERRIFEVDSGDMGRTILTTTVPNTRATDSEYHQVTVDCITLAFDEPDCFVPFRELGLSIVGGLQPKE